MVETKQNSSRWVALILMSLAIAMVSLQYTMISVGLSTLSFDLNAEASETLWFMDAFILTFAGLLLPMGALGDKYGRKRFLMLGLFIFGLGSIWASLAGSSTEFIVSQVVMGIGAAMFAPQTLAIIVDVFKKKKERVSSVAIWAGMGALGAGIGILVGGLLLENYNIDSLFYVNLPVIAVVLLVGIFVIPESKKLRAPSFDWIGALLSTVSVVALVKAFMFVSEYGWSSTYFWITLVVASVFAGLFVTWESVAKNPLLDTALLKERDFIDGVIGAAVVFFNIIGVTFMISQFLQIVQQKTAVEAGLLILPMAITIFIASLIGQQLANKFGYTRIIAYGVALTSVGVLLISFWNVSTASWVVATSLSVMGLGAGLALAPATNSIMRSFTDKDAAVGTSVNLLVRQVMGAIGVAVMGTVLNAKYSEQLQEYVLGAPEDIASQITGSIQGAYEFAQEIAFQGQQVIASSVISTVNSAFMVGMSTAVVLATIVTIVLAVNISRNIPKN